MVEVLSVDVLVLGGGPAGACAAKTFATAGASVAFVERSDYGGFRIGETLPPEANVLLAKLGLAGSLGDECHLSSPGSVAAWGRDLPHENDFIFSPFGHGWYLDRCRFDESLAGLAALAGAEQITKANAITCESTRDGDWCVALTTSVRAINVTARWVIDATGRSCWFTRSQRVTRRSFDRLIAVVAVRDDCEQPDPRTFIEAMPDGWWYVSALPGNRVIAAYFTDFDLHDLRSDTADSLWNSRLSTSCLARDRLEGTRRIDGARVVSCATTKLTRAVGDGWLAVGDAARTIDPLSSQGISWAIASGCDAANAVLSADPGLASARYEAEWDDRFRDYLASRQLYYATERRWPDSPFWRRRSVEPVPLPLTHSQQVAAT